MAIVCVCLGLMSPRKIQAIIGLFLAMVYALVCIHLKFQDFWRTHFFESGFPALLYEIDRLVIFTGFVFVSLSLGTLVLTKFVLRSELRATGLGTFIHAFFIGIAIITIFGNILARIGLLYWYVVLPFMVPFVFLSPKVLADHAYLNLLKLKYLLRSKLEVVAIAILIIEIIYITLSKGFVPDMFVTDSLGHYLPYYQSIFDIGKLAWPTTFYINYFFLKSAGLHLLMGALSDVNATQLISFVFFLASGLIIFYWLKKIRGANSLLVRLSLLILYFASPTVLSFEFQKIHMMSGALFLYLVFGTTEWFFGRMDRRLFVLENVVAITFSLVIPTFMIFVALMLVLQMVFAFTQKNLKSFVRLAIMSLVVGVTVISALTFNYIETGMVEITPFSLALKLSDSSRRPPGILLWHTRYMLQEEGAHKALSPPVNFGIASEKIWTHMSEKIFSQSPEGANIAFFGIAILFLCFLVSFFSQRRSSYARHILLISISLLFVVLSMTAFVSQNSFYRGLTFLPALRILNLATIVSSGWWAIIYFGRRRRVQIVLYFKCFVFFLCIFLALKGLIQLHKEHILRPPFLALGHESFSDFYGFQKDDPCTEARKFVGKNQKIALLHFVPACVGKPVDQLETIDPTSFSDAKGVILLREAGEARSGLQKMGFEHFLYIPHTSMYIFAFYPIFQPESLLRNFRIEKLLSHGYLLTWRREGEAPLSDEFMNGYSSIVEKDKALPSYLFYHEWIKKLAAGER